MMKDTGHQWKVEGDPEGGEVVCRLCGCRL